MKLFISWSGVRSKAVAESLRQWIPDILQAVTPWMSAMDIDAGARWSAEIERELEETHLGILCVTKRNQVAPWLLFEAGALAKAVGKSLVCPYLVDLSTSDLKPGPLTLFQAKTAVEKDTLELVQAINRALPEPLAEERLTRLFDKLWPELKKRLDNLPVEGDHQPKRSTDDMIEEVLGLVRELSRRSQRQEQEIKHQGVVEFARTLTLPTIGSSTVVRPPSVSSLPPSALPLSTQGQGRNPDGASD
jgi:hypothetical protein